ncbi:MAG: GrpB family protein ['Candidatus Kapabacteria' thiocyanatum]|uniref:GrpB family protein n=1 Tax=Candidatus Kapaibacterium thiocyanatum TaxID=1895771 RepID=A0A1M3KYD2_9BACT|nr:GrpB family protein ['Candidatus Kapabacteria' thiocyanatum]OJX57249.1 MAG: hypothetical protein BGO89_12215 ['Candidatus Kapabacteria' thiocyanatum]
MNSAILIEEYDPAWQEQFTRLRDVYASHLGHLVIGIEHVGSTSVPGLAAKPVLDIDLIVTDEGKLGHVIPILEGLGYEYAGDLGIKDRYMFRMPSASVPMTGDGTVWPKHHLYCCIEHSISLTNHLLLRNALRADAELATEYGRVKKGLAAAVTDIDDYVEGKSAFIAGVLSREGIAEADIEDIAEQNRKK